MTDDQYKCDHGIVLCVDLDIGLGNVDILVTVEIERSLDVMKFLVKALSWVNDFYHIQRQIVI